MNDHRPIRMSRRTTIRRWLGGSASLTLLALSGALPAATSLAAPAEQAGGPAPAQVPSIPAAPARTGAATTPAVTVSTTSTAASSAAATTPSAAMCVLTPEQTEGPYYIDVELLRSDITEGKDGLPLKLDLTVLNATTCQPLPDATVEIWHCDAAGDYSGFSGSLPAMQGEPPGSSSSNPPPGPGGPGGGPPPPGAPPPGGPGGPGGPTMAGGGQPMRTTPTNAMVFLRGGQISDSAGTVTFQTIYPGWYMGRTVHMHLKVHAGGQEVHTSQMFFEDATSDQVFMKQPYAAHAGRDTMNATDSIYLDGGAQGMLALTRTTDGFTGTLTLGVKV